MCCRTRQQIIPESATRHTIYQHKYVTVIWPVNRGTVTTNVSSKFNDNQFNIWEQSTQSIRQSYTIHTVHTKKQ